MSSNYLIHHGVEGQKWGDRNGPPYPLDKSKYSAKEKRALKKANKEEIKRRKNINRNRRLLSDDEIKKYNKRLEEEEQLNKNLINDNAVERGKAATNKFLSSTGSKVLTTVAVPTVIWGGSKAVGKIIGDPSIGNQIWKKYISVKK